MVRRLHVRGSRRIAHHGKPVESALHVYVAERRRMSESKHMTVNYTGLSQDEINGKVEKVLTKIVHPESPNFSSTLDLRARFVTELRKKNLWPVEEDMATDIRRTAEAIIAKAEQMQKVGEPGSGGYGALSPLVASYSEFQFGRPYGDGLSRDWETFLSGAFGPLTPIRPVGIDSPQESGRPEPRRWQYPVGFNMPIGTPGSEPGLKLASFASLRYLADVSSVVRSCVQVRQDEILGVDWDITMTDDAQLAAKGDEKATEDFQIRKREALKFFKRPDPNYFDFQEWLGALLEEMFVIDAVSIYLHPSRVPGKGLLGSDLAALDLLSGDTIRPLLDVRGGSPQPPNPAYQQYSWGVPRSDLMGIISGTNINELDLNEKEVATYRGDQLLYVPLRQRAHTPYGFSCVEMALIPSVTQLRRQEFRLEFFTEGCHDETTEVLTKEGWKLWPSVRGDEEFATRSEAGSFEWQRATELHRYPFAGDLLHFHSKTFDMAVTPNHRMLVKDSDSEQTPRFELAASVANRSHLSVPTTAAWCGRDEALKIVPTIPAKRRHPAWEECASFIVEHGAGPASEILEAADKKGLSQRALYRAKVELGVESKRVQCGTKQGEGEWHWREPSRSYEIAEDAEHMHSKGFSMPTKAWCEFVGLWLAEGWIRYDRHEIHVSQSRVSKRFDEAERIVRAVPLKWRYDEKKKAFSASSKALVKELKDYGRYSYGKRVPSGLKELSTENLEAFLHGFWVGDGSRSLPNRSFSTVSAVLADDIQEMLLKCGRTANRRECLLQSGRVIYTLTESVRKQRNLPRATHEPYDGFVYCATVPNSTLYTRRNGAVAVSGNSIPGMLVIAPEEVSTPEQIRQLQDALNAMAGDQAWKQKILVLGHGASADPIKPIDLASQADENMYLEICMPFEIDPSEIGLKIGASGKGIMLGGSKGEGASQEVAKQRRSMGPVLSRIKSIFDFILQEVCNQEDMEWTWTGVQASEDESAKVERIVLQVGKGFQSVDEGRDELGLDPWGLDITAGPVYASAGGLEAITDEVKEETPITMPVTLGPDGLPLPVAAAPTEGKPDEED